MLVKPFQRITKYPLLIKCILKKTQDDDHSTALKSMVRIAKTIVIPSLKPLLFLDLFCVSK